MKVEEVISRVAELCRQHDAQKVILYGSRAKGTALERSDIDIAVSGVVSLKRLLNQSILKSWSSKMIKKSLEAYFFTLKNKIVFCKKQF